METIIGINRWAWIRLKSHGCWVWMRIPDGEPYPDLPPPGAAKETGGRFATESKAGKSTDRETPVYFACVLRDVTLQGASETRT